MDHLLTALLDLLHELGEQDSSVLVAGGFGLYLKRRHLESTNQRMLFGDYLPKERATEDLDLFLRVEVLANHGKTKAIADAILKLDYRPITTAKYMQWVKHIDIGGVLQPLKIDVMVGPLGPYKAQLKTEERRARPKQKIDFHARRTEEAIYVEHEPLELPFTGRMSNGQFHTSTISVPQAFPYLMMKLHAFDDRKNDSDKKLGRHHALDIYSIVAMMTESEYERTKELGRILAANQHVARARSIVREHFTSLTSLGLLRLREHDLFRNEFRLAEFIEVLAEVFREES